ncbi:MAG: FkbM family methyltransferase [Hyphomicrobiaceae bacterium]
MGRWRSGLGKVVKHVLARQGFALVRPDHQFGLDPWADVGKLSRAWSRPITTLFDVGANDGETAIAMLRQFPAATVTSFEPHPATFAELLAEVGDAPRFTAVNAALGADIGEVAMFEYEGVSKINSLTPDAPFAVRFDRKGRQISVKCTTLDTYCAENGVDRIDVLKIDTEGFDHAVLQGSAGMLKRQAIGFISVEFNDLQPKSGTTGGALVPIDQLLRPHGYRFVAAYNDSIATAGEMFAVSNALFALPPNATSARAPQNSDVTE